MKTLSTALAAFLLATPLTAATLTVPAGGNLNTAIAAAAPGDEIVVQAGATFTGPFRLPAKPFGAVITVRSSATLPLRQVGPGDVALLPRLETTPGNEVLTITNVSGWKFDGINFGPSTQAGLIEMQGATNITLDRIYIDVDVTGQRRCILGNGKAITLTRSWIVGCRDPNSDSQAFAAWDGAGPYTITNNHLEAESEVILFGGERMSSAANLPADVLIEGNTITRPLAKKGVWTNVKNLIEFKAVKHAIVRGNLIENNWSAGQSGYAFMLTPRNQYGDSPWVVVDDVLIEKNVVRNTTAILNVLGYDNEKASGQASNVVLRNCLLLGTGGGMLALIQNEAGPVTIDHNTYVQPQTGAAPMIGLYVAASIPMVDGSSRVPAFAASSLTVTNNLLQVNTYGVHSSDAAQGTATLAAMTKSYAWTNNTLGGKATASLYPPTTTVLTLLAYAALFDPDYKLLVAQDRGWGGPYATASQPPPPAPACTFSVTSAPPDATAGWTVAVSWTKGATTVVCK